MSIPNLLDVSKITESIFEGLDGLFTSKEEKLAAKQKLFETMQQPHILQAITNIEEAQHSSVFVAGWRPALGWLSAACLGYAWIIKDFIMIAVTLTMEEAKEVISMLPAVDTSELMTLVTLLLGLGGIRAYEAINGVKRNSLRE